MADESLPSIVSVGSGSLGRRPHLVAIGLLATALIAGAVAPAVGHRMATSAFLDLGPTDSRFVQGFRDIERDGPVYFRWTSGTASRVTLPVRFCGPGSLRLRVRRHLEDPAVLSVSVSGTLVGQRSIQARNDRPYDVIEFLVPKVVCTSDTSVLLESSGGSRPDLGVAADWIQLQSNQRGFQPRLASSVRGSLLVALATGVLLLVGAGARLVLSTGLVAALLVTLIFALSPVAAEPLMRGSLASGVVASVLGAALSRLTGVWTLSSGFRVALVFLSGLTILSRLAFLHPQAFYPDYRVHALVQQTLGSLGLPAFMDQLFEIQYARSLGLQLVGDNWYPFPYPPGAYLVAGGLASLFSLEPLESAICAAVIAAALMPLLTVSMGRLLGLGPLACLGGAFFVALQPLLVRRMALGYFPGVIGQFMDAMAVILIICLSRASVNRAWPAARFGAILLGAFLVYTQSIVNFGLLVVALLAFDLIRTRGVSWFAGWTALAAATALAASFGAFYWRYAPVMENAWNQRAQPESEVLERLDHLRRNLNESQQSADLEDINDPFAGESLNPGRGLMRLGSRLWRFYGPFSLAILPGLWLLLKQSAPESRSLLAAWASVALSISLLAAGLPSPNGFQHLKDLEFVTPLAALGLGMLVVQLQQRGRGISLAFVGGWAIYAIHQWALEFAGRLQAVWEL